MAGAADGTACACAIPPATREAMLGARTESPTAASSALAASTCGWVFGTVCPHDVSCSCPRDRTTAGGTQSQLSVSG